MRCLGRKGFGAARGDTAGWMEAANLNIYTMEQPGGNFSALLQRRKQGNAGAGGITWNKPFERDGSESDATGSCDGGELGLDLSHANSSLLLSPSGGGMISPRSATDVAGFPALPTKDPPPPASDVSNPNTTTTTPANGNGGGGRPLADYVDDDVDILALVAEQVEKERQQQEALRREIELQQQQLAAGGAHDIAVAAGLTDPTYNTIVANALNATDNTVYTTDNADQLLLQKPQALTAVAPAADPVVSYDIVYSSEGQEVVLEPTSNAYYRLEDVYGVPRAAMAFADCPGEDGNVYRCVAVTASMAAARAALATAWVDAQDDALAAAAAQEQLRQQAAAQPAVLTASEMMFGVQQPHSGGYAVNGVALVAAKAAGASPGGSPYGGKAKGAATVAVEEGGEDDDDDVSDLMALLCA